MRSLISRRIGAGTYLLAISSAVIAWSVGTILLCKAAADGTIGEPQLKHMMYVLGVALAMIFYPLSASRLRDLNFPGWSVKVLAFPLIGVILLPLLCFLSGQRWANDFGTHPRPSGIGKTILAVLAFLVATTTSHAALQMYRHHVAAQAAHLR